MIEKIRAQDIMLTKIIVCKGDDLVAYARLKLLRSNIGAVPIVEENKLVGILTHRDILFSGKETVGLKIKDLMSKDLFTVDKDMPIKKIAKIMSETGYQRLPVVEEDELIGLITQSCIIKAVSDYL